MFLVHRFGGWYSDTDVIFIRQLIIKNDGNTLRNVIASDALSNGVGRLLIANGVFHNEAGHLFLETAINLFNSTFINGKYTSSGPKVVTKALEKLCEKQMRISTSSNPTIMMDCAGMNIVDSKFFYPFDWFHHTILNEHMTEQYWDEQFKDSILVHYYQSSSRGGEHGKGFPSVLRPNHYGKRKPALAYFAPKECPFSFYSTKPF